MSLGFLQHMVDLVSEITDNTGSSNPEPESKTMEPKDGSNSFLYSIPRHYSADQYHNSVASLIKKGLGNVFLYGNKKGITPLHYAISRIEVHSKTLGLLSGRNNALGQRMSSGDPNHSYIDLNAVDINGNTILHWAVEGKRSIQFLMNIINLGDGGTTTQQRLNVTKQNNDGNTFLHLLHPYYYSSEHYHEIVEFILRKGLGNLFRVPNKEEATPFHLAVYKLELLPKTLDLLTGRCTYAGEILPIKSQYPSYVDLNVVDKYGDSIFHYATKGSRSLKFLQYIESMILEWQNVVFDETNVSQRLAKMKRNQKGNTVLHHLAPFYSAEQYHEIVEYLIEKGLGDAFRLKNYNGMTPVHIAVYHIELLPKTLELLVGEIGLKGQKTETFCHLDLNAVDNNGNTIFHWAVEGRRSLPFLRALVNLNRNWNNVLTRNGEHDSMALKAGNRLDGMKQNNDGNTVHHLLPQQLAMKYPASGPDQYHDKMEFLVNSGLSDGFRVANKNGLTPVHLAIYYLDILPKTLDLLAGRSSGNGREFTSVPIFPGWSSVDKFGDSILHWALRGKRKLELVQDLVKLGADWKTRNHKNVGVLHMAASHELPDHVKYFTQLGCDVNAADNDGNNPLHSALRDATNNLYEIVQALVSAKVDKGKANKKGKTALKIAMDRCITDIRILNALH